MIDLLRLFLVKRCVIKCTLTLRAPFVLVQKYVSEQQVNLIKPGPGVALGVGSTVPTTCQLSRFPVLDSLLSWLLCFFRQRFR